MHAFKHTQKVVAPSAIVQKPCKFLSSFMRSVDESITLAGC